MSSKRESGKKHESLLTYLIFTVIIGYAGFLLVSTQIEYSQKQQEFDEISVELSEIEEANAQLERYAAEENRAEYIEEIARDKLGYAHPQEQIFYIIPSE